MLHGTRRLSDSASDYKNGERAAAFLDELVEENPEAFEDVDVAVAKIIIHNHSLDDHEGMTIEEVVFKDSDALDRFRFNSGPDMRYMRTPAVEATINGAYNPANLSRFFLDNGYTRQEDVLKAAEALRLVR